MGGLSAIFEVLSFEAEPGVEVGWMRKWCWQGERRVSDVGEWSSVWRRGKYLCAAWLVAQTACMIGYLLD